MRKNGRSHSLPLGTIAKLDFMAPDGLLISCKDFRSVLLTFPEHAALKRVQKAIKKGIFPHKIKGLFAYKNKEKFEDKGWDVYDVGAEFIRQGECLISTATAQFVNLLHS